MKSTTELTLVNKEAAHLFNCKTHRGNSFFESVTIKIHQLIKESMLHNVYSLLDLVSINEQVINLTSQFYDEIDKFEAQLEIKSPIGTRKINFVSQFKHEASCSNELSINLIELVEVFDKLISVIKLLHLSGCFDSQLAYYKVKEKVQKSINRFLSQLIKMPRRKKSGLSANDVINETESYQLIMHEKPIDLIRLQKALKSSFAPGASPQVLSQQMYRLNKKIQALNNHLVSGESC